MAISPDAQPYVDLTLYDPDTQRVIQRAIDDATAKFPNWVPREGNTEVVLIESLAMQVVELAYAINRVPGAVVEVLLKLFDVEQAKGAPPSADLTIDMVDAAGYLIPAGTRVVVKAGLEEPILFTTASDLAIAPGDTTGTVTIVGDQHVDDANGVPAGTGVEIVDSIPFVNSATLASDIADGVYPESSEEYFSRGVQQLSRLVSTLVLPGHFTSAALAEQDVVRAMTNDLYDPTVGTGAPGDHPGHVTVAVLGDAGATLSATRKNELAGLFESQAMATLTVHVVDPDLTTINVTIEVVAHAGYDTADVETAVAEELDDYLDPTRWPWNATVRVNEIIALVDRVTGVDYVATAQLNGATQDVVLSGHAPLVDTGTVSVTATTP